MAKVCISKIISRTTIEITQMEGVILSLFILYRSLEDINTVLEYAKLELSDVKPTVQCIYFSQQLDNQSFKLLELNDTVLETLTNGEKCVLK